MDTSHSRFTSLCPISSLIVFISQPVNYVPIQVVRSVCHVSFSNARAISIRCFSPLESVTPLHLQPCRTHPQAHNTIVTIRLFRRLVQHCVKSPISLTALSALKIALCYCFIPQFNLQHNALHIEKVLHSS